MDTHTGADSAVENLTVDLATADAKQAPVTEQDVADADPVSQAVERIARANGWKPKGDWRSDDGDFLDPEAFLSKQRDDKKRLQSELRDLGRVTNKIITETKRNALEQARQELRQANAEGDPNAIAAAEKKFERAAAGTGDGPDPAVADFVTRNASWWNVDHAATEYASNLSNRLAANGLTPTQQVAEVEKALRKTFPELMGVAKAAPAPKDPAMVSGGQRTAQPSNRAKTLNDVPAEARKQLEGFHKRHGLPMDDLVRTYFEERNAA